MHEKLTRWSVFLITVLIGISLLVIVGWAFDIVVFRRPVNGLVAMNPMTATSLLCAGSCFLLLFRQKPSSFRRTSASILAFFVLVIGSLRFISILGQLNIPVDTWLFTGRMEQEAIDNQPTRMAPITAACLILIGIMLLLYNKGSLKILQLVHSLAIILGMIALLSLVGYLYQVEAFYGVLTYIPVALHTAICFFLISLAILFKTPGTGIMKEFSSTLAGSTTARRLLPAAIVLPVVLGFLRLWGDWAGLYSKEFGVAVLVVSIIAFFLLIIWYNAVQLNKKDLLRIQTESSLRDSEEKFQKAFVSSPAGVTIMRLSDYTFQDVNDSFLEMTGFKKKEIIGKRSVDFGLVTDMEKREGLLQEIKKNGSIRNFELTLYSKDGKAVEALGSAETILLNEEPYLISIMYDISERKIAERQLEAVNKELEAFSYSVSHDLRAPLRIIDGYTEILQADYGEKLDAEGKRILDIIMQNAQKMGVLIDDLLNLSRQGRKELQLQPVDMNAVFRTVIEEQRQTMHVNTRLRVGELGSVDADPGLIRQVWINLLSNAIKYSRAKEQPEIEVNAIANSHEIIYTIKDNGVGFNMKYADKLFGVFQRLHKMTEFEGTGIGLALVNRIISRHGGRVWADAEPDKGASFSFSLPLAAQKKMEN